jgi:anti-sigma factor RsiW
MTDETLTDEALCAYLDDELPPERRRHVERALVADPSLRARLDALREVTVQARAAFDDRLVRPVPEALEAAVRRRVAQTRAERPLEQRSGKGSAAAWASEWMTGALELRSRWAFASLAGLAIVAAGVGGGYTGYRLASVDVGTEAVDVQVAAQIRQPDLLRALDQLASGQVDSVGHARVEMVASFVVPDGNLCREFRVERYDRLSVLAVACRGPGAGAWVVTHAASYAASAPAAETFSLAASVAAATDAYLTAIGAGPALSPEQERAALAR